MSNFTPLYESTQAAVPAGGAVTLTIEGPRIDHVWMGTLTINGATAGASFSVTVGSQQFGSVLAPGPGGPFQLFRGIKLVATATGLTPGALITAVLAGTDFKKDAAPPYIGPTSVTSVNSGGP